MNEKIYGRCREPMRLLFVHYSCDFCDGGLPRPMKVQESFTVNVTYGGRQYYRLPERPAAGARMKALIERVQKAVSRRWGYTVREDVLAGILETAYGDPANDPLTLNEYQVRAGATAIYPGRGGLLGRCYVGLKLAGEAGEVAEKLGKALRDNHGVADREAIGKELGDVLWYLAQAAHELGLTLDDVAKANLAKLSDRAARGVIGGSGDNR